MAVDLSALPANLKDYAVQYRQELLRLVLISEMGFLAYMQLIDEVTDEIVLTQMFTNGILQPGNKDTFDPKTGVGFKARKGKVRPCKVDMTMKPTQLTAMYKSYLGKIKASTRKTVYDLLFEEEIMNAVIEQVKQDLQLNAVFKGQHKADGTLPGDTMDGLLFIIDKDLDKAKNVFAGQAATVANAVEQVEGVSDLVPSQYAQKDLVCLVDPNVAKFYNRDYRTTYGSLNYNQEYKKVLVDGTNTEIISEPGLSGTNGIIITPRNNFTWLTNSLGGTDSVTIEKNKRNIDIMMDFEAAPEVSIMELVWTNSQVIDWVTANKAPVV